MFELTGCKIEYALSFFCFVVKVSDEKAGRSSQGSMLGAILGGCLLESATTILCSSLLEPDSYFFV